MKNNIKRMMALCLCAVLITATVGIAVFAETGNGKKEESDAPATVSSPAPETGEIVKNETVYVLAAADGSVQKIIVSDWIKNTLGAMSIEDTTALTDVLNVNGDETASLKGDGSRVWDAEGNDIYYQGNIEKELPVTLKVSYSLDGKSISPDELKGKSGNVTIRFDYQNNQYETVKINGKDETIYVPFAMLTGLILDHDVFSDIEVSNGKLLDDGSRTVVAGLAFPGLQENLGIDAETLEIPNSVTVTANVKNFSLGMTVTVATNALFNDFDTDQLNDVSDLSASLTELSDAMGQLIDGSAELYNGLNTLLEKSGELSDGVDTLTSGAKTLKNGASDLDSGVGELQSGAKQLAEGLDTLVSNNDTLNGGAKQIFETLLSTAKTQLTEAGLTVSDMTPENYATVLNGIIESLDSKKVYAAALETVTKAVEAKRGYITEQVTAAVREKVKSGVTEAVRTEVEKKVTAAVRSEVEKQVTAAVREGVKAKVTEAVKSEVTDKVTETVRKSVSASVILAATGMEQSSYDQAVAARMIDQPTQAAVSSAIDAQMQTDPVKQTITQNVAEQMSSETVTTTVETQTEAQMSTKEVQKLVTQNTETQMSSDTVKSTISSKTDEQMASDDVKTVVETKTDEKMGSDEIKKTISENADKQVEKAISESMAGDEVQAKLTAASDGAKEVISLKTSLDSYNTFYLGLQSYTDGVSQAASGANAIKSGAETLKNGSSALSSGANTLYEGLVTLKNSLPALTDGVTQLRDGSSSLSSGLKTFNEEGIQKLISAFEDNVSGLVERLKATVTVSKNYRNFAGLSDGMQGQVKFIYRTEEIEN